MDEKSGFTEAIITINGQTLTMGQSMTIRVAIENFAMCLTSGLGEDETGRAICERYKSRIKEIRLVSRWYDP